MINTVGNMARLPCGHCPNQSIFFGYNAGKPGSLGQLRPPLGKIHYPVDTDPSAAYFRQVKNGRSIRMALLAAVLGKAQLIGLTDIETADKKAGPIDHI
jgi:hypothetical protein